MNAIATDASSNPIKSSVCVCVCSGSTCVRARFFSLLVIHDEKLLLHLNIAQYAIKRIACKRISDARSEGSGAPAHASAFDMYVLSTYVKCMFDTQECGTTIV